MPAPTHGIRPANALPAHGTSIPVLVQIALKPSEVCPNPSTPHPLTFNFSTSVMAGLPPNLSVRALSLAGSSSSAFSAALVAWWRGVRRDVVWEGLDRQRNGCVHVIVRCAAHGPVGMHTCADRVRE